MSRFEVGVSVVEAPLQDPKPQHILRGIPDIGKAVADRFGTRFTVPQVIQYEPRTEIVETRNGFAMQPEQRNPLTDHSLAIQRIPSPDGSTDGFHILLMEAATGYATSNLPEEYPYKKELLDAYRLTPYMSDPQRGIHFQGRLRHDEDRSEGSMVFEYERAYVPEGVDPNDYQAQQMELAREYLLRQSPFELSFIEILLNEDRGRIKRF